MTRRIEKNPDNVHRDILEIAQIELEGYPYDLRQRRKATDLYASKGLCDGIAQEHLMKAFPDDKEVLDSFFRTGDNEGFHNGIYWSKKFMLVAVYNFLYKLCPHLNPDEFDVVISVDEDNKPELEIKYYDYGTNDWEELTSIIEYQKEGTPLNPMEADEPEQLELALKPNLKIIEKDED